MLDTLTTKLWESHGEQGHMLEKLVNDLAHHESPIAQWLDHPTRILEGHGFEYFDMRTLLCYLQFFALSLCKTCNKMSFLLQLHNVNHYLLQATENVLCGYIA